MNVDFTQVYAGIRDDFIKGLPERCDRIEQCVLASDQDEGKALEELYRHIHSLKGSGGTFGLPMLSRVCHQFEGFISLVRERYDQLAVSHALAYSDLLRRIADDPELEGGMGSSIVQDLEQLRISSMPTCASVLLVEPSVATQTFCTGVLEPLSVRLVTMDRALPALEVLLHQPFDLLIAARELPDLNALALVAALRESGCRNKNVPVILVSSNPSPVPAYLNIQATIKRDANFVQNLGMCVGDTLAALSN